MRTRAPQAANAKGVVRSVIAVHIRSSPSPNRDGRYNVQSKRATWREPGAAVRRHRILLGIEGVAWLMLVS